jgi:PhnB protein
MRFPTHRRELFRCWCAVILTRKLNSANECFRLRWVSGRPGPDGNTIHAALILGEARIIIQAEFPQLASRAPQSDGSSPVVIFVYVDDVDRAVEMTLAAGGNVLLAAQNQFWGDRSARVMDPSGHVWTIASRIEETSEDQRKQRWEDIQRQQPGL